MTGEGVRDECENNTLFERESIYEWVAPVLYRLKKKIEKNKSEHGENLSRTFDRASFVVYKSSIFPTASCFVSEKNEFY